VSLTSLEREILVQEAMRRAEALRSAQGMASRVTTRIVVTLSVFSCLIATYDLALLVLNVPVR
jgi:hypothetical protein